MTLLVGTRLGPYEILAPIGAGGMGEVYRARHTRLEREVAVKVLPASLSEDEDRLRRFEREARAASALNHPNIVTIYEIGSCGEAAYMAMELVEGATLRDVLAREGGALPTKRILEIAVQVAEGLAKAHASGIVHRDLKPENVMVTQDGLVKILDFGLAKLTQPEGSGSGATQAATVSGATEPGIVMGTVGYMSPEQATGKAVDFRSDQFSFGAILYEMTTGRRAFARGSAPETLAAIIREEPEPIAALNAKIPAPVRWIVERCLAKEARNRYASTEDLARDLATVRNHLSETTSAVGTLPAEPTPAATGLPRSSRWLIGVAAAGVLAAAVFAALYAFRRPSIPPAAPIRFAIRAPVGTRFAWVRMQNLFAVSPDGRRIVFVARSVDGRDSLWVRSLAEPSAVALPGTEDAAAPFWSTDSRFIGFFADGKLKKIDSSGGPPVTLCEARAAFSTGSWGSRHAILFAGIATPFISLVPEGGGAPTVVLKADASRGNETVTWPSFLPDGRHFLYVGRSEAEKQTYVRLANIEDGKTAPLLTNCSRAQYVPGESNGLTGGRSGYLLYGRDGNLLAQPFDTSRLQLAGDAFPVGQEIWQHALIGTGPFSASYNGVLASRGKGEPTRLVWIDRIGREAGTLASPGGFESVRISPDSRRVVVNRIDPRTGTHDLLIGDPSRGVLTSLDLGPNDYQPPVWSPDGTRLVFGVGSIRHPPTLYRLALGGSGTPELILPPGGIQRVEDWSPDGRFLLYFAALPESGSGLWVVNAEGERKPRKLLSQTTDPAQAQFSPDGRWIAYCSPESGRPEVYLTSFPEPGERVRVSVSGGARPRWKRDGRELYFVSADNEMIAAPIRLASTVEIGEARPLFRIDPAGWTDYDVTPDGARFLAVVNIPVQDADAIAVTANWLSVLGREGSH